MKTTLVIMAAGLGSRFGGIKQLTPVGPGGEIIMDYSVYDAVRAGFDKVVFIIRKDLEKDFREIVGDRLSQYADVEYVFQELDDLPAGYRCPDGRTKPWGTGQAVLSCRGAVNTPFLVINADDYYGREAFETAHEFLMRAEPGDKKYNFCMVGFELGNTLSENGTVTRGVCEVNDQNELIDVVETFELKEENGQVTGTRDGGVSRITLPLNQPVSMNMWGFTPDFFDELDREFKIFLMGPEGRAMKSEYLLPTLIDKLIKAGTARVEVLRSKDQWFGVTYREDKDYVAQEFLRLSQEGIYPVPLFKQP